MALSATTLVTVLRLAFPGVDQYLLVLIELLKGAPIEPERILLAIGDTFLWLTVAAYSFVIAIIQLAEFIESESGRSRFKDFLEFGGVTVVAISVFLMSSVVVLQSSVVEILRLN